VKPWIKAEEFAQREHEIMDRFNEARKSGGPALGNQPLEQATEDLQTLALDVEAPLDRLESLVGPWVDFMILPIFAFANAGIPVVEDFGTAVRSPIAWGVFAGLFLGKPLGVISLTWLSSKVGLSALPEGVNWHHIIGVGILGGIGFTMSLFITNLALPQGPLA